MTLLAATAARSRLANKLTVAGIVLCSLAFNAVLVIEGAENATVGVYFESRCPDSKRFVLDQLLPTYREIGDIFKMDLVPFGHARVVSSNKMICQHGPRECEGNRLMACIQNHGQKDGEILETIGCLFEAKLTAQECVKKHLPNAPFEMIEKCKTGEESFRMMTKNEQLTGRVGYVPHLTFNGAASGEIQQELEYNLKSYICNQHSGTKPDKCKEEQKPQQKR